MTLQDINNSWSYLSDNIKYGTKFDVWELPEPDEHGMYISDCESYCRLLRNKVELFKDWDYYYCKLDGIGHCVLIKNGDIVDCNVRCVVSLEHYCKIFRVTDLRRYSMFEVGSKILFGKGFLIWKKLSYIWSR